MRGAGFLCNGAGPTMRSVSRRRRRPEENRLELYLDPVATTSRAVLAMCRHERIEVTLRPVSLMKGEHYEPAFAALNPNRLVPVLVDGDLVLTESSAILRYLARKRGSALYPAGAREAARVDELIGWFESNFYRDFGYQYVYPQLMPHHRRASDESTQATVQWGREHASRWLGVLDGHFLKHRKRYLLGEQLSIADFHGASIVSLGQLVGCGFEGFANVQRWCAALDELESWRSANAEFRGFVQSLQGQRFVPLGAGHARAA
jgi:glutathione S-transferase